MANSKQSCNLSLLQAIQSFLQLEQHFPENYTKAVKWCRKIAEQGDKDAQLCLGQLYYNRKKYKEACKWLMLGLI